jgi:hypothetical protein
VGGLVRPCGAPEFRTFPVHTLGEKKANVKWRFGIARHDKLYSESRRYVSISWVTPSSQRSAAVTAAASIALTGSTAALLIWGWLVYSLSQLRNARGESALSILSFFIVSVLGVPPVLAVLGLQTGIGLFRLQAWARKSAMVWAGTSLTFCLLLVVRYPYEIFAVQNEHFVGELAMIKQFLAQSTLILLIPTSVWWLILFTRESVKAQFEPSGAKDSLPSA